MRPPNPQKLLVRNGPPTHVSIRTVVELENVLIQEWGLSSLQEWNWGRSRRGLYHFGRAFPYPFKALQRSKAKKELLFAVLMGVEHIRKVFPHFHRRAERKGLYVFDCWPSKFERMAEEVERYGIDPLFLSSEQAAKGLRELLPDHPRILHVPEGIDPSPYRPAPFEQKDIQVLQFGRKHPDYHEALRGALPSMGYEYLYETEKGQLVFPDPDAFIKGLGRARISICFPASMTDPELSGGISTLTQRYFQSMASKCLVVGSMPEDAKGVLPDGAVIEADLSDPAGQIQNILERFDEYVPLIERNYREVMERHTWKERIVKMRRQEAVSSRQS